MMSHFNSITSEPIFTLSFVPTPCRPEKTPTQCVCVCALNVALFFVHLFVLLLFVVLFPPAFCALLQNWDKSSTAPLAECIIKNI